MLTKLRICLYIALLMSSVAAASEATVKQAMQKGVEQNCTFIRFCNAQ